MQSLGDKIALTSIPETPHYRISLFYGPDSLEGPPPRQSCVFNVKKRSWRTGVQVAVELTDEQVAHAKEVTEFTPWLLAVLSTVPDDEREDYRSRAEDLFVQTLCGLKLDLAIQDGLAQENQTVGADALIEALTRALPSQGQRVRSRILAELDVAV